MTGLENNLKQFTKTWFKGGETSLKTIVFNVTNSIDDFSVGKQHDNVKIFSKNTHYYEQIFNFIHISCD